MTMYFSLSDDDAKRYLKERDSESPLFISDLEQTVGEGPLIDLKPIDELRELMEALKCEFPQALSRGDRHGGQYERQACELVHRQMSLCPLDALRDPSFWTWLAVARFADIVEWRFGDSTKPAKLSNYGVGDALENMMYRLWLRGEIGHIPGGDDPYALSRAGDQDLWRSHIIRQNYGNAREIARALLRLQSGMLSHQRLDIMEIRSLAKELKRRRANVMLEVLSAQRADAFVVELCEDLGLVGRDQVVVN